MKKKYMSAVGLSALLLALFLPVFYFVIFYGANLNYNEQHKIVTAMGNKTLLLYVAVGACLLAVVFFFHKKNPLYSAFGCDIRCAYFCIQRGFLYYQCQYIQKYRILWWLGLWHGSEFRPVDL